MWYDEGMNTDQESKHQFEAAGLGVAPFRYVGFRERRGPEKILDKNGVWHGEECGSPGQPMGTCKFCGQCIAICCEIVSADGKRFIVGSDCVEKTGDAGLRKVKTEVAKYKREQSLAKERVRIAQLNLRLSSDMNLRKLLASKPHPQKWRRDEGESLLDSVEWFMDNAGHSGKIKTARMVSRLEKRG